MPVFWDTPAAPWLPILVIHIRPQVKTTGRRSQSYKLKKIAKSSNFEILQETLNKTHFLKLLDKMYKHKMDPTWIEGTTEQTRYAGRRDGWTNRRTDGVKPIYPQKTLLCGGIIMAWCHQSTNYYLYRDFNNQHKQGVITWALPPVKNAPYLWCTAKLKKKDNHIRNKKGTNHLTRSRPKLNYGAGRDYGVGPEFGATRKQPIIPGNSRARSCAGEEDWVTWLDIRPG